MFSLFQFQFRRRIDHGGLQILNRPLTLHIETADRIYLISPEFHTDRKFLRQRIKIENPAPHSKLPGSRNFRFPLVPHRHKLFLQFCKIQCVTDSNLYFVLCQFFHRRKSVQQCIRSCQNGDLPSLFQLHQRAHNLHPLTEQIFALDVRMIKQQIFRRIVISVFLQKTMLLIRLLCFFIGRIDPQPKADFLTKRIHQMCFLRIHTSRDLQYPIFFCSYPNHFLIIRQFGKRYCQCFHDLPTSFLSVLFLFYTSFFFRLYSFIAAVISPSMICSAAWSAWSYPSSINSCSAFEKWPST